MPYFTYPEMIGIKADQEVPVFKLEEFNGDKNKRIFPGNFKQGCGMNGEKQEIE